jgi:uncharacterized protein (DUF488 family)
VTPLVVFTIGHSTRAIESFIRLRKAHGVQRVIDVRSIPRSRHILSSIETNCLQRSIVLGFTTGTCPDWVAAARRA